MRGPRAFGRGEGTAQVALRGGLVVFSRRLAGWLAGGFEIEERGRGGGATFAAAAAEPVVGHVAGQGQAQHAPARRHPRHLARPARPRGARGARALDDLAAAADGAFQKLRVVLHEVLQHAVQKPLNLLASEELAEVRLCKSLSAGGTGQSRLTVLGFRAKAVLAERMPTGEADDTAYRIVSRA